MQMILLIMIHDDREHVPSRVIQTVQFFPHLFLFVQILNYER